MGYTSKHAQDSLSKHGRHVEKGEDDSGGKWKSVETKKKLKEKYKDADGNKSKQVTNRKTGERKTITKAKGGKRVVVRDNPQKSYLKARLAQEYDRAENGINSPFIGGGKIRKKPVNTEYGIESPASRLGKMAGKSYKPVMSALKKRKK